MKDLEKNFNMLTLTFLILAIFSIYKNSIILAFIFSTLGTTIQIVKIIYINHIRKTILNGLEEIIKEMEEKNITNLNDLIKEKKE